MSRHSYKWDIIHVQRGAAACGDQEPASRGTTRLYSNCPWAILLLTYGTLRPGQCVETQTRGSTMGRDGGV